AYATRDDLNITSGASYSSEPFVFVAYQASDGRPAMAAFRVLREKPEAGYVFDYITEAGRLLQPPMPLPLLAKPVEGSGDSAVNYNQAPRREGEDLPVGWDESQHLNSPYAHYALFTFRDRKHDFWVYRGLHAGLPALEAGRYDTNTSTFGNLPAATAGVGQPFRYTVHVSREDQYLGMANDAALPSWLAIDGLSLTGTPGAGDVGSRTLNLTVFDRYDGASVTKPLSLTVAGAGAVAAQAPLSIVSTNPYTGAIITFTTRPPFLARSPAPSNSFTMRFYYKTEPSFAWPGVANPPPAGSIVPYLRPKDASGQFVGDPASKNTESLEIVYRPLWPVRDPKDASKPLPTLPFGATLATPKFGLPGVRDFKTAHIMHQQSVAANIVSARVSTVLHDATREKFAELQSKNLEKLPGGVRTDFFQGKYFFPNLPPHLASRLFFEPNRGAKGSLVFRGEFKDELFGEKYLLLNVLRGSDLGAAKALCPDGDPDKSKWDTAIGGLATTVETFYENPAQPGTYISNPVLTKSVGLDVLAEITSAEMAVDSYAISATGPGRGYITLLEASGTAFTQPSDPVAMHIFKVGGPELYVGETKVIVAANPLSEQVTFQHTADLAGRFAEYEYEWKIGAPVDGLAPEVDAAMSRYVALVNGSDLPRYTLGGASIRTLSDNYVVMRYRPLNASHPLYSAAPAATATNWSAWTKPALAEGWIKRVLAGINPFNQRVSDLFNNRVSTDVSILTQAGRRWEGEENPDQTPDGIINAADAARMFPQGHGDAYGQYLTALKGYYSLLLNSEFDWVPRIEAVTVLGQPVSVDYLDERKFAAAAAAVARAGQQVFDLTWRKDYQAVRGAGWEHFGATRSNTQRAPASTRFWGMDHWASRTGQGAYLNWVADNAIVPEVDPNPNHEGIQKVDRTTVPELQELVTLAEGLQTALDNAEAGLSPLGLPQGGLAFDINPNAVVGTDNGTHFEQVYQRAKVALNNALAAFDDAKDVTRLMRSEQDSLADFQATVARQEQAYTNALIELYGTPYPDDIGPGKTYKQGYAGPDLVHYMHVDLPETIFPELWSYTETDRIEVEINNVPKDWQDVIQEQVDGFDRKITNIVFELGSHGFFSKPKDWSGQRASPGKLQQAISETIAAHTRLRQAANDAAGARNDWGVARNLFKANNGTFDEIRDKKRDLLIAEEVLEKVQFANDLYQKIQDSIKEDIVFTSDFSAEALPGSIVVGLASGGDLTSAGRAALEIAGYGFKKVLDGG
ncbi:MAG: hypothetical protein HY674_21815, partial [Chloroflexi bacterium]|nr:hypothetical protein [Chloroflexota bacterium]